MKKEYITPATEVVELNANLTLLSGSIHTYGSVEVTYDGTGIDEDEDGFLDDAI